MVFCRPCTGTHDHFIPHPDLIKTNISTYKSTTLHIKYSYFFSKITDLKNATSSIYVLC